MIPIGAEIAVVPETISPPAGPPGRRILELPAMQHDERSSSKIFEVPVGNGDLIRFGWEIRFTLRLHTFTASRIPFAPTPDGSNIHMIDVERPAIPLAKSANETLVVVEENGIVVVGKNPVRFFDAADSFIQQPLRSPGLIFGDNPNGERLPLSLRLSDDPVHQCKIILTLRRLQLSPGPTEIGHGRMWILIGLRRIAEPEVEVRKTHPGIV